MARVVREPIQVYLTRQERSELDRVAKEMGVSRSEALRRGVRALGSEGYEGELQDLTDEGLVTPPKGVAGDPPPSAPVAALNDLMKELAQDRQDP
jgi:hypothetical protein